jgi:hypothetical protein
MDEMLFGIFIGKIMKIYSRGKRNHFEKNYFIYFAFRFGDTNLLFNQLITYIVQSFENEYYYSQVIKFYEYYN